MTDVGVSFHRPFAEQVAALRLRLGNLIETDTWLDVQKSSHDRGFMVAGAAKGDLLADFGAAIDKAVTKGTTLDEFRRDFRQIVARHGWTGWAGEGSVKGEAWRTKVIYQTNMLTSWAAGRHAQLIAGKYAYWVYLHSGSPHPRLHHLALNGLALPPDHPFWQTHYPPNGWGCGCRVFGARTEAGIRRQGGDPAKQLPEGWNVRDAKGNLPGVGKGWDYAPGATVSDAINDTVRVLGDKLPHLPAPIGAAMFHAWPQLARDKLSREFEAFVDRSLSQRVEKNYMIVGALHPRWIEAANTLGIRVESAEIAVTDKDVQHAFRGTLHVTAPSTKKVTRQAKAAPVELNWYKGLVNHLLTPNAVLLDTRKAEPAFLLIYDLPGDGDHPRLVLELNTWVKKANGFLNTVQTGTMVSRNALAADINQKLVTLIDGEI